ncbi:MAG TPA: hypothetical protein VGM33_21920 [Baekduia sp.]
MRRSLSFLSILVAAAVLAALPTVATAAPLTWGARVAADPTDGLSAIACPSAALCVAGAGNRSGSGAAVDRIVTSADPGNAASWTVASVTVPDAGGTIVSMACPAASLCVGVDDHGRILSSTDPTGGASAWHVATFANHTFSSVSCASTVLCVAIDFTGRHVLTSTGPSTGVWSEFGTALTWGRVSCTAGLCAATGGANVHTSTTPADPASWTQAAVVPSSDGGIAQGQLSGIACLPGLCVAADSGGAFVGSGTWSTTHPLDGAAAWTRTANLEVDGLSCVQGPTTNLCTGWSSYGAYVMATTDPTGPGTGWSVTPDVADASVSDQLAGVSCPAITTCVAATDRGAIVIGMGAGGGGGSGSTPAPIDPGTPGGGGPTAPTGPTIGGSTAPPTLPSSGYPGAGLLGNDVYAVTGNAVSFLLSSATDATGSLAAATQSAYAASAARAKARHKPKRRVTVGSARFTLKAHQPKHVKLVLTRGARRLLASKHTLKVRLTITATPKGGAKRTTVHTVTLKQKRPRH